MRFRRGKRDLRAGFVLITTAACLAALIGLVGLAIDIGRVIVAKNELRVFVDEAAMAAAFELDGTPEGLDRSRSVASTGPNSGGKPNRWYFGTLQVTVLPAEFGTLPQGTFDANPPSAIGQRFVKVQVNAAVDLYFLPIFPGISHTQAVPVSAIAGQCPRFWLGEGLEPFTPTAHNANDPDYGFTTGQLYTLRWGPSGSRNKPGGTCAGDIGFDPVSSSDRGYVDVGQGTGASAVRDAVVNNSFYLPAPIEVGTILNFLTGQQSVPVAMDERVSQDTDVTSSVFRAYHGNGRRLVTVAVNDGGTSARVVGFAAFFLPLSPCGSSNTSPCCAEYIGAAVIASAHRGAGVPGLYTVQLVE